MDNQQVEALRYAQAGWPIFPLWPYTKTPATSDGFKSATSDPTIVKRWWDQEPLANIGLWCRDFLVLDVDGPQGKASLEALETQWGKLPDTLRQRTPRDGNSRHYLFHKPEGLAVPNSAGRVGPGLDVRGADGYIVIAPSLHPQSRTAYKWDTHDGQAIGHTIADCPQWLLNLAVSKKEKQTLHAVATFESDDVIPKGQQHYFLMSQAGRLARQFRGDDELIYAILRRLAQTRLEEVPPMENVDKIAEYAIAYAAEDEPKPYIRIVHEPTGIHLVNPVDERGDAPDDQAVESPEAVANTLKSRLRFCPKTGKLLPSLYNAVELLRIDPDWCNSIYYDLFACDLVYSRDVPRLRVRAGDKVMDIHHTQMSYELQADVDAEFPKSTVIEAMMLTGCERSIHPVREYFKSLKWDGVPRIDTWIIDHLGAHDVPLIRAFSSRWLIAAVARVMVPGSKVDTCLIFEGLEGGRKSTVFRELCPVRSWFSDEVGDLKAKDTLLNTRGKLIIEMAELTSLNRTEVETAKAFITRQTDTYRSPYGRVSQDWPRQFVLCGTTNQSDYLVDGAGGHRRFWPVAVAGAEEGAIAGVRDKLWAEAVTRYQAGEKWWLHEEAFIAQAAAVVDARVVSHPWEDTLRHFSKTLAIGEETTAQTVLSLWLDIDIDKQNEAQSKKVGRIMRKLGWQRVRLAAQQGTRPWGYRKIR